MQSIATQRPFSRSCWTGPVFSELVIALLPLLTFYTFVYQRLPDIIPVHFDANNIPNRFAGKDSLEALIGLVGLGILGFLIGKILRFIVLLTIHFGKNENNKRIGARIMNYTEFFVIILFSLLCLDIQQTSLGLHPPDTDQMPKVIFIGINVFLVLLGNISPKITPNKCLGIKTPYAFSSDEAWIRVQRFGGKVLFWGGLFNIAVTFILPADVKVLLAFNMTSIFLQVAFLYFWKPGKEKTPPLTRS